MAVLRAIVQDFVETSEPVGSRALLERHNLGVSAATIRGDMAALEEEGLVTAPHTSAGRIPTDAGYRLFVDRLASIKPLRPAERAAIAEFLRTAVDLDDVVDRTVRLLSSLTHQVAMVQYPSLTRSTVRHVELVPLGPTRLMVVLILNTGRVEQRVVDSPVDLAGADGEDRLARVRSAVNAIAVGRGLAEAAAGLETLPDQLEPVDRGLARTVATLLDEALVEEREERVVMAGQANLVRGNEFRSGIGEVLEALEQHVILLKLLNQVGPDGGAVAVRIGHENPYAGLHSTSMVTTAYGPADETLGGLGVVGPTRMDYPSTMAAVRAVAAYLSQVLAE
ncbi:Heat-inducible transcription repressor hrcA [Nostocoides japonicum T1-X7]|uniref:Heat-inducible transcription repressor HrcA n=2 Tax=Nostocoides japonicum TaxID=99481 RepID=A0A077M3P8_9MICO|nr:Heat-inducible transcription repressor hrcA [Tetrasphaera japonica T1-X7]